MKSATQVQILVKTIWVLLPANAFEISMIPFVLSQAMDDSKEHWVILYLFSWGNANHIDPT